MRDRVHCLSDWEPLGTTCILHCLKHQLPDTCRRFGDAHARFLQSRYLLLGTTLATRNDGTSMPYRDRDEVKCMVKADLQRA